MELGSWVGPSRGDSDNDGAAAEVVPDVTTVFEIIFESMSDFENGMKEAEAPGQRAHLLANGFDEGAEPADMEMRDCCGEVVSGEALSADDFPITLMLTFKKPAEPFSSVSIADALGSGAHAKVFRGNCRITGKACAVKVATPQSVALLEAEAAILRQLDHPHIAKLLGSGESPQGTYIAMEYCAGGDMFVVLDKEEEGKLPERATARIMKQLLSAVGHMHSVGVCHRDLKDENLLVERPAPVYELTIKICDFGISSSKSAPKPMEDLRCTVTYAAPEVLQGGAGEEPSDLWSCGVILYLMLFGSLPFEGKTRAEVLAKVGAGTPSFQGGWSFGSRLSEGAEGLIRRLLRMNSAQRYSAQQALQYPWVARQAPGGRKAQANQSLMTTRPSAEQVAQLTDSLQALEGAVVPWELSAAISRAGVTEDTGVSAQLKFEANQGNGFIDYSMLLKRQTLLNRVRQCTGIGTMD